MSRTIIPAHSWIAALFFLFISSGFSQKAPFPNGWVQLFDANGAICIGCKLSTCSASLSCGVAPANPLATYTTAAGGTPNSNPVILDSTGGAQVWLTPGLSYKLELYTAANVLIRSGDNIPGGSLVGTGTVTANQVYGGPASGAAATPTFRALVSADIPNNAANTTGNAATAAALAATPAGCAANTFANAAAANGDLTCATVGPAAMTSQAGRTVVGNAAAAAGVPAATSTVDVLAVHIAEIPSIIFVTTDFTTSGVGTALENITGLTFTLPATTALNVPFTCKLTYSQAVANVAVAFGIRDVTVSPTNIGARGVIYTSASVSAAGSIDTLTTTTATAIVAGTPSATATDFVAEISGLIEAPSNASSSVVNFMASTAAPADLVTVRRGSFCHLN